VRPTGFIERAGLTEHEAFPAQRFDPVKLLPQVIGAVTNRLVQDAHEWALVSAGNIRHHATTYSKRSAGPRRIEDDVPHLSPMLTAILTPDDADGSLKGLSVGPQLAVLPPQERLRG
jgi:hypothetical protein